MTASTVAPEYQLPACQFCPQFHPTIHVACLLKLSLYRIERSWVKPRRLLGLECRLYFIVDHLMTHFMTQSCNAVIGLPPGMNALMR
jgi:hypothetical protein